MSANNHITERRIYGGLMTVLEACGLQVMCDPTGNHHMVKGTLESAAAFYKLTVAGADAAQLPPPVARQEPAPRTALAMVLEWEEYQRISDIPAVHEALQDFSNDPTGDNGVYIVREVLKVAVPAPAASAQPDADEVEFRASRLRRAATLVGLSIAVPESDEELLACMGSVLGSICLEIEKLLSAQQPGIGATRSQPDAGNANAWHFPDGSCKRWCGNGECKEGCAAPLERLAGKFAAVADQAGKGSTP